MPAYRYQLSASREAGNDFDTLTGLVESHHPMTDSEIRAAAIDQTGAEYINFGAISVEEQL
ncbi:MULTISPECIES: hypothetical protein [Aeromonas]|jgi:hypothetical protein|uniref:hypothetical protein n=1 Tax=Aeromonas TaxID=642 RepID=UPI000390B490|nr:MULTISPECIES: hypothetical protein [Aeromonas]MBL0523226.1 hypothetical protein [Aeromonas enteropelogenes]QMS78808.1 hypothetical protein M001_021765 [Aeromonas veronii Hm21]